MQQHGKNVPPQGICAKKMRCSGRLASLGQLHMRRVAWGQNIRKKAEQQKRDQKHG